MTRLSHIDFTMESSFDLGSGDSTVKGMLVDTPAQLIDEGKSLEIMYDKEAEVFSQIFAWRAPTNDFDPIKNTKELNERVIQPLMESIQAILTERTRFLIELEKMAPEVSSGEEE